MVLDLTNDDNEVAEADIRRIILILSLHSGEGLF